MSMLDKVKTNLGITGAYQDATIQGWIDEVKAFLIDGGVPRTVVEDDLISAGIISRGVSDLWNYGSGDGKLSPYFFQRATQLSYKNSPTDEKESFYNKEQIDRKINDLEITQTKFLFTTIENQNTFEFEGNYDVIEVFVNHLKLNESEYTIQDNLIIIQRDLTENQKVEIVLLQLRKEGV